MEVFKDFLGPQFGMDSGFRWVITILSLSIAAYLTYRYGNEKALQKTIDVQKNQLEILDKAHKSLKEEYTRCSDQYKSLETEIKVLQAKTDLSQVIELVNKMQAVESERHIEKIRKLTDMMEDIHTIIRRLEIKVNDADSKIEEVRSKQG